MNHDPDWFRFQAPEISMSYQIIPIHNWVIFHPPIYRLNNQGELVTAHLEAVL